MSKQIKYGVITEIKGQFTHDFYYDMPDAYDDLAAAQKDILNGQIEKPLSIISINTTNGEVFTVMNRFQLEVMVDEEERAKEQDELDAIANHKSDANYFAPHRWF